MDKNDQAAVSDDDLRERISEVEVLVELTIESFGSAPAALLEKLSILRELQRLRAERRRQRASRCVHGVHQDNICQRCD